MMDVCKVDFGPHNALFVLKPAQSSLLDSTQMIVRLHTLKCFIYEVVCVISGAGQYELFGLVAAKGLE